MYLLEEVHIWDHSTRKAQPQLELEFSKFYKRVKLIALYSHKNRTKQKTKRATIQHLTFKGYIKACFNIYFFNSWRRLFLFNLIQSKNTLHVHIIANIAKISLKRVEINFCPWSKNSIFGKTLWKPEDMTELSTNNVTFTKFHW
jgi:hypothetical protein